MNAFSRGALALDAQAGYGRKILFTAVKNEAPFLLEWIAYHQVIGFDTIIIFSNDSDDGTTEVLDALDATGEITHHYHTVAPGERPQGKAAEAANDKGLMSHGDWVLWLDADEFLVVNEGDGYLSDLIERIGSKDGALINWRLFGDSGNSKFPGRFISAHFTQASLPNYRGNVAVKTLFRHGPGVAGFGTMGVHRPRLVGGEESEELEFFNPSGILMTQAQARNFGWKNGVDSAGNWRVSRPESGHAMAQINHYAVRTPEFFELKKARGRGWEVKPESGHNGRHTMAFYDKHNKNDCEDRKILKFEKLVTQKIDDLLTHKAVRDAQRLAQEKIRKMLIHLNEQASVSENPRAKMTATAIQEPHAEFELTLPEEEAGMVKAYYGNAKVVLEYGSGGSTFLAKQLGVEKVLTVESDRRWAKRLQSSLEWHFPDGNVHVQYVNIGPTRSWGRPRDDSGFARYPEYASSVWDLDDFEQPDVVLIDGRFRVACFLATLLRTLKPVDVLFDDYFYRERYHWIEEFSAPVARAGRMAHFRLGPTAFPPSAMTRILKAFVNYD